MSQIFSFEIFFLRVIFIRSLHISLMVFRKCSVTFHCNLISQNADMFFFCALGVPETEEQIKLAKNKIHLTYSRFKGDSDAHI